MRYRPVAHAPPQLRIVLRRSTNSLLRTRSKWFGPPMLQSGGLGKFQERFPPASSKLVTSLPCCVLWPFFLTQMPAYAEKVALQAVIAQSISALASLHFTLELPSIDELSFDAQSFHAAHPRRAAPRSQFVTGDCSSSGRPSATSVVFTMFSTSNLQEIPTVAWVTNVAYTVYLDYSYTLALSEPLLIR
jgi:hypothetical protein